MLPLCPDGFISVDASSWNEMTSVEKTLAESDFIEKMKEMDVRVDDTIVCYDSLNMIIAPRVSWMMRAFGAKNVFVLNGTFLKWI